MRSPVVTADRTQALVEKIAGDDLHAKCVLSVSYAVLGVVHAATLAVHAIGVGLSQARGTNAKHSIKQVDRLLSNANLDVWAFFAQWVPYVLRGAKDVVVALDWTDFDKDGHATVALYVIGGHGRAAPLMWMSVAKSEMKGWRNTYEDDLLTRFREVVPREIKVTIVADRGFGDIKLYDFLKRELGFEFIIRFRGIVNVENSDCEVKPALEWLHPTARPRRLVGARVTKDRYQVASVVAVQAPRMAEPWFLAVSDPNLTASMAIKLYGKRFTIEESFRDVKDPRFGMGLSATRVGDTGRRDRLLLIAALATELLTSLGAAGESLGMDRMLKANTVKRRTHSLLRQGTYYYGAIPMMKEDQRDKLVAAFGKMVVAEPVFVQTLGLK